MTPFWMARRAAAAGMRAAEVALGAPEQLGVLWHDAHELVARAQRLLDRLDTLASRAEARLDELDGLLASGREVLDDGAQVAGEVREIARAVGNTRDLVEQQAARITTLLDRSLPSLESLVPLGREAAALLRPAHLRGLASLLDELPALVDRIEPALQGMGDVAPRLEAMTVRVDNVGQVLEGIPGADLLKRRGQKRDAEES